MMIRSHLCVEHWLLSDKHLTGLLQLMDKWVFGNVNWYTDTLQQKIEITDFKYFLAAENTSVLNADGIVTCFQESSVHVKKS